MTDFKADHPGAVVRSSPNFGERRNGRTPTILLLHYTGMESGKAAEDWLCNPESQVSSHYLVHEDGSVIQLVREAERAWHAGQGSWQGVADVNSGSIGIEITNPGHFMGYPDFPEGQIAAVIDLCRGIVARHAISARAVLAHSDVAPGRKIDPGEKFPWQKLHEAGVGHLAPPAQIGSDQGLVLNDEGDAVMDLQTMLALYGYGLEKTGSYDAATHNAVEAFQRHFRPERVDGVADVSTVATLRRLLETLP